MRRRSNLPQYKQAYACEDEWERRRAGGLIQAAVAIYDRLTPVSYLEKTVAGQLFLATDPPIILYRERRYVPAEAFERFEGLVKRLFGAELDALALSLAQQDSEDSHAVVARINERKETSRVYFIQSAAGGNIKIGVSYDVAARLQSLQIGSPTALRLLASIPGSQRDERVLHLKFRELRCDGEWFRPEPELLAHIASIATTEAEK